MKIAKERALKIKIKNWDKIQCGRRKDQKTYPWLKLKSSIYMDDKLHVLSPCEKWVFICILCKANEENSSTISINIEFFSRIIDVKSTEVTRAIKKLIEINVLEDVLHACIHPCDTHVTLDKNRIEENRIEENRALASQKLSLDSVLNLSEFANEKLLRQSWIERASEEFVSGEEKKMFTWLLANPKKVPTRKGFSRFYNSWLERGHESYRKQLVSSPVRRSMQEILNEEKNKKI